MQESSTNPTAQGTGDFAGLLAALAAARPSTPPAWSEEELPHDVATLSYERALQTHARYRPANVDFSDRFQSAAGGRTCEVARDGRAVCGAGNPPSEPVVSFASIGEHDRKCASITIRMSKAECEQLKRRAAEAGLTISAYLRSCTFEAEALRAQVKDALAELRRADASVGVNPLEKGTWAAIGNTFRGIWRSRLRRLVPDLHPSRRLSRA